MKAVAENQQVKNFLNNFHSTNIQDFKQVKGGHVNSIYSYKINDKAYIMRIKGDREGFDTHEFLYKTYGRKGIPMASVINIGKFQDLFYCITEEISGFVLNDIKEENFKNIIPSLLENVTKLHMVDVSIYRGYGNIDSVSGNGKFKSLKEHIQNTFSNDTEGFWNHWHKLYETTVLEKQVFDDFYTKAMELSKYAEVHRHLVHGDCHYYNIITDGDKVTGIIDWDGIKYGDFLFDIASLDLHKPYYKMPKAFKEYYDKINIEVPNFKERFLCAVYFRGIDCLRFHAKINDEKSYYSIKKYLNEIENADFLS